MPLPPRPSRLRRATVVPAALVGLVLAVAATARADPDWAQQAGVDFWNHPALAREIEDETEHYAQLDERALDILRRIEVKEHLLRGLAAGRATLAETAAQFLTMDQGHPAILAHVRREHPGATDEEKMARNVIRQALLHVADSSEKERVALRLGAEFRVLFPDAAGPVTPPTGPRHLTRRHGRGGS